MILSLVGCVFVCVCVCVCLCVKEMECVCSIERAGCCSTSVMCLVLTSHTGLLVGTVCSLSMLSMRRRRGDLSVHRRKL